VPLFAALVGFGHHPNPRWQRGFRRAFAAFSVIHAGLHWHLRHAPESRFDAPLSIALIAGAAVCGAIYVVVDFWPRPQAGSKSPT
jgi:hypothetical protein